MTNETEEHNELCKQARMAYWRVVKTGLTKLINQAPAVYKGPDAAFYRTEQKMIARHMEPLYWGACVSIFLFGTFRISGSRWYAHYRETSNWATLWRSNTSTGSIPNGSRKMDTKMFPGTAQATGTAATRPNNTVTPQWKSFLDQKVERETFLREEALQLPSDIIVSLLCGVSSILWLSKPQQAQQDLAEAPLLTGKSEIVDCFCADMVTAFTQTVQKPTILTEDVLQQDDTLRVFFTMVKNCRVRAEYTRVQTEQGNERPDVVPYPGLDGVRRSTDAS